MGREVRLNAELKAIKRPRGSHGAGRMLNRLLNRTLLRAAGVAGIGVENEEFGQMSEVGAKLCVSRPWTEPESGIGGA